MKTVLKINVLLTLVILSAVLPVKAQIQPLEPVLATSKTSFEHQVTQVKHARKYNIRIITANIHQIGYGNLCVAQATRRMGFEFVPMPISEIEEKSRFHYFMHNQIARVRLTFKNGPFWQGKLKRYIRECRRTTGDFTG